MKILIIDSQTLFAEAILLALRGSEFDTVRVSETGGEGLRSAATDCPDLVLIDPQLPDGNGIDVGARILERCRNTKLVALTDVRDPERVSEAMRDGFHGYLTKDVSLDYFLQAIKIVLDGGIVIPRSLGAAATGGPSPHEQEAQLLKERLTAREFTVLQLLVEGVSGPKIARGLAISPNTVRAYIQNILSKLQVHSRLEAVMLAIRHGLVEPPNNNR